MESSLVFAILLAIVAVGFLIAACRTYIADARGGFEVSMGGEMLFSQRWLLAGAMAGGALKLAGIGGWWAVIAGIIVFVFASYPVRRLIKAMYLGADVPLESVSKPGGFAAMDRKAREQHGDKDQ